jgi:hypothetical protein
MTYRSPDDALAERKAELEARLSELRAKQKEHAKLAQDATEIVKELEETYARLNTAGASKGARRSLPLLQRLYVASPCNVPWESMRGDDHVRHCASCDKEVFDLSSLTREQAEALLVEKNGKLCAQYYRRDDGTILTADCEVGVAKKKKARRKAAVIAGAFAAAAAGAVAGAFAMRNDSAGEVEQGCEQSAHSSGAQQLGVTATPTAQPARPPSHEMMRGDVAFEPSEAPPVEHRIVRGAVRRR